MVNQLCTQCDEVKDAIDFADYEIDTFNPTCKACIAKQQDLVRLKSSKKSGAIYIIKNPAWPEWCKIGLTTISPEHRLNTYQTSSPLRDYYVEYSIPTIKVKYIEYKIHTVLAEIGYERNSEWFKIEVDDAVAVIEQVVCILKTYEKEL